MDALTIVLLIVSTIIFGLILYLTIWGVASKTKAKDKVLMIFIVAAIAVWLIPVVGGYITGILVSIGDLFSFIPNTTNHMGTFGPIILFLLLLIVVKLLLDMGWDRATWITLISLFLLFLLFSIIPYIGSYMTAPV